MRGHEGRQMHRKVLDQMVARAKKTTVTSGGVLRNSKSSMWDPSVWRFTNVPLTNLTSPGFVYSGIFISFTVNEQESRIFGAEIQQGRYLESGVKLTVFLTKKSFNTKMKTEELSVSDWLFFLPKKSLTTKMNLGHGLARVGLTFLSPEVLEYKHETSWLLM